MLAKDWSGESMTVARSWLRQISPMRLMMSCSLEWTGPPESGVVLGWATTSLAGLNRRRSDPLGLDDGVRSSSSSGGRLLFGVGESVY